MGPSSIPSANFYIKLVFFAGWAISRCLSTDLHPIGGKLLFRWTPLCFKDFFHTYLD